MKTLIETHWNVKFCKEWLLSFIKNYFNRNTLKCKVETPFIVTFPGSQL